MDPTASSERGASRAEAVLAQLPAQLRETSLTCPLCSSPTVARGLVAKANDKPQQPDWFIAFTCPACGLLIEFDDEQLALERLKALDDSIWTERLRRFLATSSRTNQVPHERMALPRQMIGLFVFNFIIWILLVGSFEPLGLAWGAIVSLVIARVSYRLIAIDIPGSLLYPNRWLPLAGIIVEFTRQLIVQNITLSIRVLRPSLPIRPGIVAVPTVLYKELDLTILGSLLSLTPDTVTMDIDRENGIIYLHWIDVKTTDPRQAREQLFTTLEERIERWPE